MHSKITLCGSARFEQDFIDANRELTLRGFVVYSLACLPSHHGGKDWYDEATKVILDLAHLAKIAASDAVVVVGDGYIGESTAREIMWADMLGKPILEQEGPHWNRTASQLRHNCGMARDIVDRARAVFANKAAA